MILDLYSWWFGEFLILFDLMLPDLVLDLIYWYRWYSNINRCNMEYHDNYEELYDDYVFCGVYAVDPLNGSYEKAINYRSSDRTIISGNHFYCSIYHIKTNCHCGFLSPNYFHAQLYP